MRRSPLTSTRFPDLDGTERYRVLVVDDDAFSRKMLRQLLRGFPCVVDEAENGLVALARISEEMPDLVLLDVQMPVLDGLRTLHEIRSSSVHAHLPVVSVSANTERSLVMRLIDLGLAGFLVKPLRPDETLRRLDTIFQQLKRDARATSKVARAADASARPRLLLADADLNFREFARPLLDTHFEVLEATTGAAAYQIIHAHHASVVCVAERLPLLNTPELLQLIRGDSSGAAAPRTWLLSDTDEGPAALRGLVDGVVRRSFNPEAFDRELRATVLAGESRAAAIADVVRGLHGELVTATQQSVGVMTLQEVVALDVADLADTPSGVQTTAELAMPDGSATVRVSLFTGEEQAVRIASQILGTPTTLEHGAGEAVAELVDAIAGRVCASLAARGFRLEQRSPWVSTGTAARLGDGWEAAIPFRTPDGERFSVAVWVFDLAAGEAAGRAA